MQAGINDHKIALQRILRIPIILHQIIEWIQKYFTRVVIKRRHLQTTYYLIKTKSRYSRILSR